MAATTRERSTLNTSALRRWGPTGGVLTGFLAMAVILPMFSTGARLLFWATVSIIGLYAITVNLLIGFSGLPTFGHAAFLGLGAYTFALALQQDWPVLVALFTAAAVAAVAGLLFSFIGLRSTGVGFAMLTLAFAQALYTLTFNLDAVGGENGLVGLIADGVLGVEFNSPERLFWFVLLVVAASVVFLYRVSRSPLGRTMRMLRDDAQRAEFLGVPIKRFQRAVLVLSCTFAGLAGALFALVQTAVTPNVFYWIMSGEPIIMSVIGGTHYFFGPLIGAVVFLFVRDWLSDLTYAWVLWVGLMFLVVVVLAPSGLLGLADDLRDRIRGPRNRRQDAVRADSPAVDA